MRSSSKRSGIVAILLAAALLASGCSGADRPDLSNATQQPTMDTSGMTQKTTERTSVTEGTLSESSQDNDVTVRVEGSRKTRFSGLCTVGKKETVITGEVPKQFNYTLDGESISCRIQKQDSTNGSLRVILLAGDTTRSVQQTNAEHGTINISYSGG